jgi:hypothetical protein
MKKFWTRHHPTTASNTTRAFFKLHLVLATLFILMIQSNPLHAQMSITSLGTAFTQNFDGIGSSATASLPSGWVVNSTTTYSSGTNATTVAYGTTGTGAVTSTSGGGTINWANGITASSTDRAVGFLTSGSFSSPRYLMLKMANNTGATITSLSITFDIEKYRSGSRAWTVSFFSGTDGSTWTSQSAGDQAYAADANNTTIYNPPTSISKTVTITGLSIAAGSSYYLYWSYIGTGGSTNAQGLGIDNFSVTATGSVVTPAITLADNGTQVAAANVNQGTTNVILHKSQLSVTSANATLTGMTCTTAGTYAAADVSNLKVRYSTDNVLDAGDATLATIAAPAAAGAKTFAPFTSQTINAGSTGYIFITVDVAAGATAGNTISVNALATTNFTFAAGTQSGSTTAGGTQTFVAPTPAITLADNGTQVAAANVNQGTTNLILHKSQLSVTSANATLTGMTCTTAGTYAAADVSNLKVRYSTDNVLDAGDATLATIAAPAAAGAKTFAPFTSQTINAGSTGYIFITVDVAAGATAGNTISVNALATTNFTFISGTQTGSTTAGGTQTFVIPASSCATDLIISEYVEGSGSEKYIEIYNGTSGSINLTDYKLQLYTNGGSSPTNDITLSGTLAAGAVVVYRNSSASLYSSATSNAACNFNGDDAVALYKISTAAFVDVIGQIGNDPGSEWGSGLTSTADNTIRRKNTIVAGDADGSNAFDPSIEWDGYATDDVSGLGTHAMTCGPTLTVVPTSLSGLNYIFGSGPSTSQSYQLSGSNLIGYPGTITVSGTANYDVSLNNSAFGSTVNVAFNSATLASTMIYVRLKAGLAIGNYNGENITNAGGGASTVSVNCSGTVYGPMITTSVASVSSLVYVFGSGPSASQTYDVSGSYLTPAAGSISLTAPADYEISSDNLNFFGSLTLPYASNTLAATPVYVRLKAGLSINTYNGEILAHSGGGASAVNVTLNGEVLDPSASPTLFDPGDIAVVGVNSNLTCLGYTAGDDEISFVSFKNINTGTTFFVTDNGYQYTNANQWGDTEGLYEITRTGGTIPAGTVITFRFKNLGPNNMEYIYPDANWSFTKIAGLTTGVVMNSGGDQLYFMQGGSWTNPAGSADVTYTPGTYLFAFNTNSSWTNFGNSSQKSGLIPGMECFSMMPGVATDFIKFTSKLDGWSATTKRGWIDRINNPANWVDCGQSSSTLSCQAYNDTLPNYTTGYSISIVAGGFSPGIWTGNKDINWFNCENWQDMTIPDSTTNVQVPNVAMTYQPTIGNPPTVPVAYTSAYCNDLFIGAGKTLTLNDVNSKLNIYGSTNKDGSISHTNGTIFINGGSNTSFGGSSATTFYNLNIIKKTAGQSVTLGQNISINNVFTLTKGRVMTAGKTVTVENDLPAAVVAGTGNTNYTSSFVVGYLKRKIALNTSTYDFPVGVRAYGRLAQFVNNSVSPATYLTASFDSTALVGNTGALNVYEGVTQLTTLCPEGVWQIDPNIALSSGNYGLKLYFNGFSSLSSADNNAFTIVKRPNPGGLGDLSSFVNGGGTINGSNGAGRMYSDGYAYKWNLSAFSQFAIAKAGGPLPVELLSFTTECIGNKVIINWETASESNSSYFVLERSEDGKNYNVVGHVRAAGNSNEVLSYSLTDNDPYKETTYYRLIQYDYNGNNEYFGPVSSQCSNNGNEDFNIISVTQNTDKAVITYYIAGNEEVNCCIYDLSGRQILCQSHTGDSGVRKLEINTTLTQGLYMINLNNGSTKLSTKLFIR